MATTANAASDSTADADVTASDDVTADADSTSDSPLADRLATAARVVWVAFLLSIIVFALIPVVGLWLGAVPFDPPATTPYFAFVGASLVGTVALVGGAILDV